MALSLPALACTWLCLASGAALAQAQTPSGTNSGENRLEKAQKAADAVFHWIKLNGEKGANRQGTTPAPAPAPAPAAAPAQARKPAPAPAPVAAAPKPATPAPAPTAAATAPTTTAAAPAEAPATTPAPAPAVAAAAPEPAVERGPVVVASAAPTAAPDAPMAAAAQAANDTAVDEVPLQLITKVEPVLPRQFKQQQSFRTGFAQVQFTVAPDGSVSQAQVIKASHARLGTAAMDAVRQWRFAPIAKARDAAVEVAFSNTGE